MHSFKQNLTEHNMHFLQTECSDYKSHPLETQNYWLFTYKVQCELRPIISKHIFMDKGFI